MTVAIYVISQNLQNLIYIAQSQTNDPTLIKDLNTIFQFVSNISLNMADHSIESKIKRASEEMTKVVLGTSEEKFQYLPDLNAKELKGMILRIINHKELSQFPL